MIDWERVREILNGSYSYYDKDHVECEALATLVSDTRDILHSAFRPHMRVLDIGCGRADALIQNADRFASGVGLDESEDHIAMACNAKMAAGVGNVDFYMGKAASLPFEDEEFDLVFSERGPMGYSEHNLRQALRVMKPGALICVETLGELNGTEEAQAFAPGYRKPSTPLGNLDMLRAEWERNGIAIQTLASRIQTLRYPDLYEWLRDACSVWAYLGEPFPSPDDHGSFERLVSVAGDDRGRISTTYHTILLSGTKAE